MSTPPDILAIDHDNYHATHVGHTSDGRQFFLTTPFVAPIDDQTERRDFVALFLFDADGRLVEARIDDLGVWEDLDEQYAQEQQIVDQRLGELGVVEYGRIMVRPFQVRRFGITFGLVPHRSRHSGNWWVTLQPGNSMAFYEPWDSGSYDT